MLASPYRVYLKRMIQQNLGQVLGPLPDSEISEGKVAVLKGIGWVGDWLLSINRVISRSHHVQTAPQAPEIWLCKDCAAPCSAAHWSAAQHWGLPSGKLQSLVDAVDAPCLQPQPVLHHESLPTDVLLRSDLPRSHPKMAGPASAKGATKHIYIIILYIYVCVRLGWERRA